MTLKKKIAVNIALAFSILFGVAATVVYYSFSTFRQEEFRGRLEEKALTTAKLLLEVKEVDKQLLKLIDQNTINKLYNEKTLVFDEQMNLIYSSIDDAAIKWNKEELKQLKNRKSFFKQEQDKDILGIFYDFDKSDYYVLIAAEDKYGNSKLSFLLYSLIITFCSGTVLVWVSTYFFVQKILSPLDVFQQQITNISANKLNIQLKERAVDDEINILTKAFNEMLRRIDAAFDSQREFTANASHEMRTPLTRIAFQTENLLQDTTLTAELRQYLINIHNDVHQLSDLINSLLLLTKMDKEQWRQGFETERLDEIIFSASAPIKRVEAHFDLDFEIIDHPIYDCHLEVKGIRSLLQIAFTNLLKNACYYATDSKVYVRLTQTASDTLALEIKNKGPQLSPSEQARLFEPYFRGQNAASVHGFGLGLRITKRILDYHQVPITYRQEAPDWHVFEMIFKY